MNLKLVCIFIFPVFLPPCLITTDLKLQWLKAALDKEPVGRNSLRRIFVTFIYYVYPVGSVIENPPAAWENQVRSLEEGMATHSSILTCKIPWAEEPDWLQSMGSQCWTRVNDQHFHFHFMHPLMELIIETNPNIQLLFITRDKSITCPHSHLGH